MLTGDDFDELLERSDELRQAITRIADERRAVSEPPFMFD